jgi:hypothetical protein
MFVLKKSIIFDIEQSYFLINKSNVKFGKPLYRWDFFTFIFIQSTKFNYNLITLNKRIICAYLINL